MFGSFTVHGGDFKQGNEHQFIYGRFVMKSEGKFRREDILSSEIEELEPVNEENVKRIGGSLGWGIAGATILGPVGLLAGLLMGGQGKDVTFICKLKDGRKFLGTAPVKIYNQIQIATLEMFHVEPEKLPSTVELCPSCGLKNKKEDLKCRYCGKPMINDL